MSLTNAVVTERAQPSPPPALATEAVIEIETRFGRFALPSANTIEMPQGLLGFSSFHEFALLTLPDPRFARFRLLQCTTEPALSFLVVPAELDASGLDAEDVDEALGALEVERADAALLLIVTIRKAEGKVDMTVNMRAPIVIDLRRQVARQYVLPNSKYSIRQRL